MPEGDSLHRAAARLQLLVGERVRAETPHPRGRLTGVATAVDGRLLESVQAVGKHVLLRFEGGVTVRSHLRMHGRWQVERRGTRRVGRPWLVLQGGEWEAVQWHGPVLSLDVRPAASARARPARRRPRSPGSRGSAASGGARSAARRGAPRPAAGGRDREHVVGRAPVAGTSVALAAARRDDRSGARIGARVGAGGDARLRGRLASDTQRLSPGRQAVQSLRCDDPVARSR